MVKSAFVNLWLSSNVSVIVILRRFNLLGNHKKQDYYFVFVEVFVKPDSKRAERVFRCFHDDIFLRMTCRPIRFLYFQAIFLSKTCQPERPARPVCQSGVCRVKRGPDRYRMPVVFSRSGGCRRSGTSGLCRAGMADFETSKNN